MTSQMTRSPTRCYPAARLGAGGAEQGKADAEDTNEGLESITYFLLAFAATALIVARS